MAVSALAMKIWNNYQQENEIIPHPQFTSPTEEQLEAWKKMPKEQALKEALTLFKSEGLDVSETRLKLEILKFISELQGALQPVIPQSMHVVAIEIITPGQRPESKIINITP